MTRACRLLAAAALAAACRSDAPGVATTPLAPPGERAADADDSHDDAAPASEAGPAPAGLDAGPDCGDAATAAAREVVVTAAGDVLVHRRVAEAAAAHPGRFRHVLAALGASIAELESTGAATVSLVNLETPLTESRVDPVNTNPPVLGSPPELAADLVALGVDVVSVANNHAMDQTPDGLADTLRVTAAAGLGAVGAGPSDEAARAAWVAERAGLRVGFLGFAGHVNRGAGGRTPGAQRIALIRDEAAMLGATRDLAARTDLVVVALHWSHDFVPRPADTQRALARRLVDAGADLIVGTGPHVLQAVERLASPRGHAVVAYSLGNLVSNQGLRYRVGVPPRPGDHPVAATPGTRDAVLFAARLAVSAEGRVEVRGLDAVAMWVVNNFWERRGRDDVALDLRLLRLRDGDEGLRRERAAVLEETLGPAVRVVP